MARIPYANHNLGPAPEGLNEVQSAVYERKVAPNQGMRRGPLLHEEGLLRDRNIAAGFYEQVAETDQASRPSYRKQQPGQTVSQRAEMTGPDAGEHPTWAAVPNPVLGAFAAGSSGQGEQVYFSSRASGAPTRRPSEAEITLESRRGRNDLRSY